MTLTLSLSAPCLHATGSTTESTDSLLKFKSYGFLCRIYVTYISGVFVLVIFDSLLKEFYGIMGQLWENNTEVTQEILNGIIFGTIGPGLVSGFCMWHGETNTLQPDCFSIALPDPTHKEGSRLLPINTNWVLTPRAN